MARTNELVLPVASLDDIQEQLRDVSALAKSGHTNSALVLGWVALEAIARFAFPDRLSKPQRAGSVLEMLAFGGYISPSQADRIRPLVALRNRFVHGELAVRPDAAEIAEFVRIIECVYEVAKTPEAA